MRQQVLVRSVVMHIYEVEPRKAYSHNLLFLFPCGCCFEPHPNHRHDYDYDDRDDHYCSDDYY